MTKDNKRDDELLKRLNKLDRNADLGRNNAEGKEPDSDIGKSILGMVWLGKAAYTTQKVAQSIWKFTGAPLWRFALKPAWKFGSAVGGVYKKHVWDKHAYKENDEGKKVLSPKRIGAIACLTAAFAAAVMPVGSAAIEGARMATSSRTDVVFLHSVNMKEDGSYVVEGCRTMDKCSAEDTVHYQVRPSIAKHISNLFNKGTLYRPELIVGAVAPDANNRCDVEIFGAKKERLLAQFGVYPELMSLSCQRVGSDGNPVTPAQQSPTSVSVNYSAPGLG